MYGEGSLEEQIRMIYREHHRDVYQFLLYFAGNRDDAEDLAQEVFLRLLNALPRFDGRSQFKTWLLSIAKHVAIDHHRKRRMLSFFKDPFWQRIPSGSRGPEEELTAQEDVEELEQALLSLKPKYRMAVILRSFKELSVRETSEVLGCSEAKVKVDYHRAVKMLQERLAINENGGDTYEFAK